MKIRQRNLPFKEYMCDEQYIRSGVWWCDAHSSYIIQCAACHSYVHKTRPHARYCGAACRQAAYRARAKRRRENEQYAGAVY